MGMGPLILTLANLTDVVLDKNINLVNEFMALKIHFFVNENEIKISMDIASSFCLGCCELNS